MEDIAIFCDFDGTITVSDSLGSLLEKFATDDWHSIEQAWKRGEMGSKECLTRQMQCIKNITKEEFDNFVEDVRIDESFKQFSDFLQANKIDFFIVSDGFSLIIDKILKKNKIFGVNIISNDLIFEKNHLIPSFPNENKECIVKNGNCKCRAIENFGRKKRIIYIGDGFSDACAITKADVVFAKDELAKYCESNNIEYIKYKDFDEIFNIVREREEYANC